MNILERKEIAPNVFFNSIRDNRFKTMRICITILTPLTEENASLNALLSQVLTRSCEKYPDFTELSKKLSSLYGASLFGGFRKMGDVQALTLSVSGIDDRYALEGESISQELSDLLCEVIFKPYLINGAFSPEEMNQERRQILDMIDSDFNDKRVYALTKCTSIMCENEPYGIARYGSKESLNAITPEALTGAWKNILKTARFEITYIGESDSAKAMQSFENRFCEINRLPQELTNIIVREVKNVKEEKEEMELSQSKLIMAFRTDIAEPTDDDVYAARLMSAVLGGTAHSKLFCNVREKLSLCYYCAARYNRTKGILIIESGVEKENIEKAKTAILNEIKEMQNGNITDFEIDSAKLSVTNDFAAFCDTASGLESWYVSQMLDRSLETVENASEQIRGITKEQIVKAANKLKLDTVYELLSK